VAPLGFRPEALSPLRVLPIGEARTRQAVRVPVHAAHAALAEVLQQLAARNITIEVHRERADAEGGRELVLLTREAREADLQQALAAVSALACIRGPIRSLRVEGLQ
jgi:homoserine dehydrogenase